MPRTTRSSVVAEPPLTQAPAQQLNMKSFGRIRKAGHDAQDAHNKPKQQQHSAPAPATTEQPLQLPAAGQAEPRHGRGRPRKAATTTAAGPEQALQLPAAQAEPPRTRGRPRKAETTAAAGMTAPAAPSAQAAPAPAPATTAADHQQRTSSRRGKQQREQQQVEEEYVQPPMTSAIRRLARADATASAAKPAPAATRKAAAAAAAAAGKQPKATTAGKVAKAAKQGPGAKSRAGGGAAPAASAGAKGKAKARDGTACAPAAAAVNGKRVKEYVDSVEIDGEVFREGDCAYVITDASIDVDRFADTERCMLCDKDHTRTPMLECDRCLRGCHMGCLRPPLKAVPKGEWMCPNCTSGGKALPTPSAAPGTRTGKGASSSTCTAREAFLGGQGLDLVRIEAIWHEGADGSGGTYFTARWYLRPEETHTGRQPHHGAREVFLSQQSDDQDAACLMRPVTVAGPAEFGSAAGDDVFLCEYEYDSVWQRFRRCSEVEDDLEWRLEQEEREDDERHDPTFHRMEHFFGGKELGPATMQELKKRRRGAGGRRNQGGVSRNEDIRKYLQMGGKGAAAGAAAGGLAGAPSRGGPSSMGPATAHPPPSSSSLMLLAGSSEVPAEARQRLKSDPLSRLMQRLLTSSVPPCLPCRGTERKEVEAFVREAVQAGDQCVGRCLYVSGVPGTGKTATVMEVMRTLRREMEDGRLGGNRFQFVEVNGLRLPSPHHAYSKLYEGMTGQQVGPNAAAALLEERFSGANKKKGGGSGGGTGDGVWFGGVTVLLVDEMDLLVTRKQEVLYNLFEWPMRRGCRLAVIGIANTMDLPERLLPRIASRLGSRRLQFQPYRAPQLQEILGVRFGEQLRGLVCERAVKLATMKVAQVSGDVRRCLELCRRGAEMAEGQLAASLRPAAGGSGGSSASGGAATWEPGQPALVTMDHIDKAFQEMFNSVHVRQLRQACPLSKALLAALHLETRATGQAETLLAPVLARLRGMLKVYSLPEVSLSDAMSASVQLGGQRLVLCDSAARRQHMRLSLNVSVDDLLYVLKGDECLPEGLRNKLG